MSVYRSLQHHHKRESRIKVETDGPGPPLPFVTHHILSGLSHQHKSQEVGSWLASVFLPKKTFLFYHRHVAFKYHWSFFSSIGLENVTHLQILQDRAIWNLILIFKSQCIKIYFFKLHFLNSKQNQKWTWYLVRFFFQLLHG